MHTGMLDHLKVDAYGERMSLKSLGSVSVRDNQLLAVSAFDPGVRGCCLIFCFPQACSDLQP
jgi:ribosome recycling factor